MPVVPFEIKRPSVQTSCVVFASPHSGRDYPESFLAQTVLDRHVIRSSEDAFVDQLFACAPTFGAPLMSACIGRAYIDFNRDCSELDPALIKGIHSSIHNPRVISGLGVVPRVVAKGQAIYSGKLSSLEVNERIATCWTPYHQALRGLLDQTHRQFGCAILADCHSMPHSAMVDQALVPTDIIIGDRFGAAANPDLVAQIEAAFEAVGLEVRRNTPFAGAFSTQTYGRPRENQHAVQIEIDRSLYMDEERIIPNSNFAVLQKTLSTIIAKIAQINIRPLSLAAE
ncbi:MAG: N-formylglutamate amidohydrolase [Aestuariivita sp.]|nr:N-formylglutamate amidohydrolase [Aestuariivita sp.]MCY4345769.1 N-formylglutamate amidohydrolase [Aestuariivita sp.]